MSETKKAAVSLLVAALVFVLTAFSSAQAWEETADVTADQVVAQTEQETSMETLAETEEMTSEEVIEETESVTEESTTVEETLAEETEAEEDTTEEVPEETEDAPAEEVLEETEDTPAEDVPEETEDAPAEENTEEIEEPTTEASAEVIDYFADQFMVTVTGKSALNVREEPDKDSKWVGKMYEGSGGTILEVGDGWSKIESGNVIGWVSNDYILIGEAGKAAALEVCELVFEVTSDALKVRSAPTTEEDNKIRAIYGGDTYAVVSMQDNGWVEIEYKEGKTGWVAAQYGKIRYD